MPGTIVAMGLAAGACLGAATAALLLVGGPERFLYAMILGGTALQFLVWTLLTHIIRGPDIGPLIWPESPVMDPEATSLTRSQLQAPAA